MVKVIVALLGCFVFLLSGIMIIGQNTILAGFFISVALANLLAVVLNRKEKQLSLLLDFLNSIACTWTAMEFLEAGKGKLGVMYVLAGIGFLVAVAFKFLFVPNKSQ
jgi:hypothetical protein